jgi:hypothetical protein
MVRPPERVDWGGQVVRSATVTVAIAVLVGWRAAIAAEPVGVITILDGNAVLIRGLSKFAPAEGVRVTGNDLLETGKSAFLRVEFTDGAIVDLGPATRVQLNRPSLRQADRAALYLLSGWLKLNASKDPNGAKGSIASREFDVLGVRGGVVERADRASGGAVFAEDGAVRVIDRRRGAAPAVSLESGDFLALRGSEAARVQRKPAPEFVASLPRQFEDRIPSRMAQFRDRDVAARPLGPFTYGEVEPWLDAEAAVRRRFVREWVARADDDSFRQRLDAGLARHPEWERILHPERFEPAPAAPVAAVPPAPPAPPQR